MSAFLAAAQLMDLVNYIAASASMDVGLYLLRAQSGLAAMQRVKFEPRPESRRSRNADAPPFSGLGPIIGHSAFGSGR